MRGAAASTVDYRFSVLFFSNCSLTTFVQYLPGATMVNSKKRRITLPDDYATKKSQNQFLGYTRFAIY